MRGTAVVLVVMLVSFTAMVAKRALLIQMAGGMPFCAISFDCGCGAAEVLICRKLIENTLLTLLALGLAWSRNGALCLRHALAGDA